jgi:hypothetical protein
MNDTLLVVITPLVVLLILTLFRFSGCKSFGSSDVPTTPTTPAPTYATVVAGTNGFTAHWRLNEIGGNIASVLGPLSPQANGTYNTGNPAGTGMKLGQPGVLTDDFAPELLATAGYVEVNFVPALNPQNTLSFSIELWVKPNPDIGGETQVVISSHRGDVDRGYEIALVKRPNEPHQRIRGRLFPGAGGTPMEVTIPPTGGDPTERRYIAMTYQGTASGTGTLTLHVKLAKTVNWFLNTVTGAGYTNVSSAGPATLRFGANHRNNQTPANFFGGRIDEVAFYNTVLTQPDRDSHFNMA